MSQTASANYQALDLDPSKALDFALVIAGWPTIYTTARADYTIPATGDISTASGFTTIRAWMRASGAGASVKGQHPEGGSVNIGQMDCEVADRYGSSTVNRDLSDLISRQAYLEGTSSGTITTLASSITSGTTTVVLTSGSGFVEGDLLYVSQECILLGAKSGSTYIDCTRGYLLTSATPHASGVNAYSFKPSVYRSKAWIYKGYQGLALDSWLEGFGGVIAKVGKKPGSVVFSIKSSTWELYADKKRKIAAFLPTTTGKIDGTGWIGGFFTLPGLEGDYQVTLDTNAMVPTGMGDGHYCVKIEGFWFGIKELISETTHSTGGARIVVDIVKGAGTSDALNGEVDAGAAVQFGWSPNDFTQVPPGGVDPITFLLQILLSKTGDLTNHATYDVLKEGIGLGIPADMVDVDSFTAIKDQADYDTNAQLYFGFYEPVEAKKFIEEELCRPFGFYLRTGNDGRISLLRSKHPQKFYVSRANNGLTIKVPTTGSERNTQFALTSGVRTGAEMATAVQAALTAVTGGTGMTWTVTYSTSTNKFSITGTGTTWDLTNANSDAWATLGFTTNRTGAASGVAEVGDVAVGAFTATDFNVLSAADMTGIEVVENQSSQIAKVSFGANYDWIDKEYRLIKNYVDAETLNLGDLLGDHEYKIMSKGLIIRSALSSQHAPFDMFVPRLSGSHAIPVCDPVYVPVSPSYGLDADNSWASLFAAHLFDRYAQPPMRFRATIPWKYNTREVGDVVRISYSPDGIFADHERNTSTLTTRLFEIVGLKPSWRSGQLEAEFIGFRWPE